MLPSGAPKLIKMQRRAKICHARCPVKSQDVDIHAILIAFGHVRLAGKAAKVYFDARLYLNALLVFLAQMLQLGKVKLHIPDSPE